MIDWSQCSKIFEYLRRIWDTAGQEKFHSISKSYFRGSDACVIVFDVTSKESFQNLEKWKKVFIQVSCFLFKF